MLKVGDQVKKGDSIIVLESMKMRSRKISQRREN